MRKVSLSELERYVKRCIKGRYKFSKSLVVTFLISGVFASVGYGADVWLHSASVPIEGKTNEFSNIHYKTQVMYQKNGVLTNNVYSEAVILSDYENKTGSKTKFANKDFDKIVVIGSRSVTGGHGGTAVGFGVIVGENTATATLEEKEKVLIFHWKKLKA